MVLELWRPRHDCRGRLSVDVVSFLARRSAAISGLRSAADRGHGGNGHLTNDVAVSSCAVVSAPSRGGLGHYCQMAMAWPVGRFARYHRRDRLVRNSVPALLRGTVFYRALGANRGPGGGVGSP